MSKANTNRESYAQDAALKHYPQVAIPLLGGLTITE